MNEITLINFIIGIIAGILAGMFGIGGGVVIVPALILLSHFSIVEANGTSLAALLLPVSIFAVISYYRAGFLNIKIALIVALGIITGVVFGSQIALSIQSNYLKSLYGIFLLWVSYNFMKPKDLIKKYILKQDINKPKKENEITENFNIFLLILVGIIAGVLSGLFGIGGGLIIVPFLITFLKFKTKKAFGTSLGALLLPVGLPGVILYYNSGNLNIGYAIPVAFGLLLGAIIGAKITISLPTILVKRIYSIFLLIISIYFLISIL
jgi:uncharacterized protein